MIPLLLLAQILTKTEIDRLVKGVVESGRVMEIGVTAADRLHSERLLAPGTPPVLAFRFLEGKERHRFGDLDLVLDDAGH
jgi:hypothetical protein